MALANLFSSELPLNRKERFFTGTVFPMIVCKDNFKHFHLLLSLLRISSCPKIIAQGKKTNIQFFTEYSLAESMKGSATKRFKRMPNTKETPDIVALINGEKKILIAIEAKMFDVPSADDLNGQMHAQREKILSVIEESLSIDEVYHYALLPRELKKQMNGLAYKAVTWEALYRAYKPVSSGDYFLELLRMALTNYKGLVSTRGAYGANCEKKMSGGQIRSLFERGTLGMVSMGREGGIDGDRLRKDIISGKWRRIIYETSSKNPGRINRNWFWIREFIRRIEGR
jgi:hypothetical protein